MHTESKLARQRRHYFVQDRKVRCHMTYILEFPLLFRESTFLFDGVGLVYSAKGAVEWEEQELKKNSVMKSMH